MGQPGREEILTALRGIDFSNRLQSMFPGFIILFRGRYRQEVGIWLHLASPQGLREPLCSPTHAREALSPRISR